jgi:putative hydrolase of the HAD superfamily
LERRLSNITALFWDIGGVILTNGWDRDSRAAAEKKFGLDPEELEDRHELAFPAFEVGKSSLNQYLESVVFYKKRIFSVQDFVNFMYSQSREFPESRAVVDRVARSGKYLTAALNNEGAELNAYRVAKFNLTRTFTAFFSSCYVGSRKPNAPIYEIAVNVTQRAPAECIFVDDREANLEVPRQMGINTIQFQSATQLEAELRKLGVEVPAA